MKGINTIEIENILNNVFIPELNKNLLSVSAIIKSDMIYLLIKQPKLKRTIKNSQRSKQNKVCG